MRTRDKACLGIALCSLLFTGFVSYQIRRLDVRDGQQLRETRLLLAAASNITSLLNSAEAGRGREAAQDRIGVEIERQLEVVEQTAANSPDQLERVGRLRLLIRKGTGTEALAGAREASAQIAQQGIARLEATAVGPATRRDQIFVVWVAGSLILFGLIAFGMAGARRRRRHAGIRLTEHRTAQIGDLLHATRANPAEAVIAADSKGTVTFLNPVAKQLTGWPGETALGQNLDVVFPIAAQAAGERTERPWSNLLREVVCVVPIKDAALCPTNGTKTVVGGTATSIRSRHDEMIGLAIVFRELTLKNQVAESDDARRDFEAQLLRLQKLESLSDLAGAIAHDLNNLLMGIVANTSLMMEEAPADSTVLGLGENVLAATEQAGNLTRQMLAYSICRETQVLPLSLKSQIDEISALLSASLPKAVQITLNLPDDLPLIAADAGQIQQLVLNLVQNGVEAVGLEGFITISVFTRTLADGEQAGNLGRPLPPGPYIVLEVKDTGPAMDEATQAKMFDPFSGNKSCERGLGLAAVLGIARLHRGGISLLSDPNGTTFRVFFPIARVSAGCAATG